MKFFFLFLPFVVFFLSCSNNKQNGAESTPTIDSLVAVAASPIKPNAIENVESHYPNGRLKVKGILKNGKRDGLWISWYENGQEWSECTYKNGLKNGTTSSWHENGMKRYEGAYKDDIKTGTWIYWDDKGNLIAE